MNRAACALTLIALAAVSGQARAQAPAALPVHIDYEGRAGCPDASTFTRAFAMRAPRVKLTSATEGAETLIVRFRSAPSGLDGILTAPGGAERVVHGQSCGEIVSALAVIASVVVASESAPAETSTPEPEATPKAEPPKAEPAPVDTSWSALAPSPPPPTPSAPAPSPWLFSVGVGVGVASGASPTLLASVDGFAEIAHAFGGIVEPAARLRLQRTALGGSDRIGGGARFDLTTGGADLCPVAVHTSSLRAQACLRGEGGELDARGNGVEPARSEARPWLAIGAVVRLRLEVGGPFFAELEGGALGLLVRDRFFVEPDTLVYRPPAVAANGSFGLGVAFR